MNGGRKLESYKETLTRIQRLSPAQKAILAQRGNITERKILATDRSIDVLLALVNSAKVTEVEIERIAALSATPEVVLRSVYASERWQKSYRVRLACLKHPRLPIPILRKILISCSRQQLKAILKDPAIPFNTKEAAKRFLANKGIA